MGKKKGSKKGSKKKAKGDEVEVDPAAEQAKAEAIRNQLLEWHSSVGTQRTPSTAFQAFLERAAAGEPAWMPGGGGGAKKKKSGGKKGSKKGSKKKKKK